MNQSTRVSSLALFFFFISFFFFHGEVLWIGITRGTVPDTERGGGRQRESGATDAKRGGADLL